MARPGLKGSTVTSADHRAPDELAAPTDMTPSLPADSLYRLHNEPLGNGGVFDLGSLAGKVTLVVNTATH